MSALMDDEANELEVERLLKQVGQGDELRSTWQRYNLARHSMNGDRLACADWDISGRIRDELGTAVQDAPAARGMRQRLARPLSSLAVAASVTAAVVFGGQQLAYLGAADSSDTQSVVDRYPVPASIGNLQGAMPVPASYGMDPIPVLQPATRQAYNDLAQRRLNRYMQEHAEQAALNAPQGLVPFARVPEIRE